MCVVHLSRSLIVMSGVGTLMIVEVKELLEWCSCLWDSIVGLEVDFLILYGSPESLDKDIVEVASSPIHTNVYLSFLKFLGELIARKLASLVSVEDARMLVVCECMIECLCAEICFQSNGEFPGENVSTVPINDSCEIDPSSVQSYVGDICSPDMVWSRNLNSSE